MTSSRGSKEHQGLDGTKVTFLINKAGEIDRVSIPLESSVKEIIFTRKPAKPEPVAAKD